MMENLLSVDNPVPINKGDNKENIIKNDGIKQENGEVTNNHSLIPANDLINVKGSTISLALHLLFSSYPYCRPWKCLKIPKNCTGRWL